MVSCTVQRGKETENQGQIGELTLSNGFKCYVGEMNWKDNAHDISCIPSGTYPVKMAFSNHFQKNLYHIQDVPNRSDVMIHNGNWMGQVSQGFKSSVLGCLILGLERGWLEGQLAVLSSNPALSQFMASLNGEDFNLTILDYQE